MKVLSINGYLLLPDDFDGDMSDALRYWIEYRNNPNIREKAEVSDPKEGENVWEDFLDAVKNGFKFHGRCGIAELKDDQWNYDFDLS